MKYSVSVPGIQKQNYIRAYLIMRSTSVGRYKTLLGMCNLGKIKIISGTLTFESVLRIAIVIKQCQINRRIVKNRKQFTMTYKMGIPKMFF